MRVSVVNRLRRSLPARGLQERRATTRIGRETPLAVSRNRGQTLVGAILRGRDRITVEGRCVGRCRVR